MPRRQSDDQVALGAFELLAVTVCVAIMLALAVYRVARWAWQQLPDWNLAALPPERWR